MKKELDDFKKNHKSKINEIEELKKAKVKKSSKIDDLKKSYKAPSTPPKMLQDARKRDYKTRTFAPPDNMIKLTEDQDKKINEKLATLKHPNIDPNRSSLDTIKRSQDLKKYKFK